MVGKMLSYAKDYAGIWVASKTNFTFIRPRRVELGIPTSCNLKCRMCSLWRSPSLLSDLKYGLKYSEVLGLIREVAKWRIPDLVVTGIGETLLSHYALDIVRHAETMGIRCSLVTNGTLIDQDMAMKILSSRLSILTISLDGATAQTHDQIRGVKGTYDKVIKGIQLMNQLRRKNKTNILLTICMTISSFNLHEAVALVDLARDLGVDGISFQPVHLQELKRLSATSYLMDHDEEKSNESDLWIPRDKLMELDSVIDRLVRIKICEGSLIHTPITMLESIKYFFRNPKKFKMNCLTGYAALRIGPFGEVFPCWLYESIGSIRKSGIREIWHSDALTKARKSMKQCQNKCLLGCHFTTGPDELIALIAKKIRSLHYP